MEEGISVEQMIRIIPERLIEAMHMQGIQSYAELRRVCLAKTGIKISGSMLSNMLYPPQIDRNYYDIKVSHFFALVKAVDTTPNFLCGYDEG